MTRREMIAGLAGVAALGVRPALADARWLAPTRMIDSDAPAIASLAARLTAGTETPRDKALTIFRFVRDEIAFGFGSGFWNQKASEVLDLRRGYCNTKSTLFVALLCSAGIPARQMFVEIDTAVLQGITDPGTPFLDHSYVEVMLDGVWIATDAYILDPPLFRAAKTRTAAEGRVFGYGVHAEGENDWDGYEPSFAQYNLNASAPLSGRQWGVYADVAAFYAEAQGVHNRLNALLRAAFDALARSANENAEALRQA